MATTANLLRLPPELMLRISTHLTTHELACFRLACKQVETNLFESFAREFFTKRQFMLEEISIQALLDIANHKTLAPHLKEVIISVDKLKRTRPDYKVDEPDAIVTTGHAHVMLAHAFSKLPNLRTIGIRDYHGKGRWREGETATWRSYGWSSGSDLETSFQPRMDPRPILPLLLYSLDHTSARLERIEVFLRRNRLPDASFDLSPTFMQLKAVPVLSNLKALLLSLEIGEGAGHLRMPFDRNYVSKAGDRAFPRLKDFLSHTPLLEHLRLNFDQREQPSWCTEAFLTWLGASPGPDIDTVPAPVTLDHLTTLDLGMIHAAPCTLVALVSKFVKLEALSLWKVTLQTARDNPDVLEPDDSCLWAYYLRKLSEAVPAPEGIKTLMIGWTTEYANNRLEPLPVRFIDRSKVDDKENSARESFEDVITYRKEVGSDLCAWLVELSKRASLPPMIESVSSEASDDENEDDDDDEDDSNDGDDDDDDEEVHLNESDDDGS